MAKKLTPWEKEWVQLRKREQKWLETNRQYKQPVLNRLLEGKVPPKLQSTLDGAFCKAFSMIVQNGTSLLERTFSPEELSKQQQVDDFSARLRQDRRSLKIFSRRSSRAGGVNLALSGVEGIALGALGIGIPDIPLFTGLMLRSLYEMACHFGFSYDTPEEQFFILKLIQASLSYGDELDLCDNALNHFIDSSALPAHYDLNMQITLTAQSLSRQLLYMKFLQGIPIVGVAGGTYDVICLNRIQQFARLKYQRRLLLSHKIQTT